jgi:hypothetical protein
MNTEAVKTTSKPSSKGALAAARSAVGSVQAALTCCLPVLPFVLAAGTASCARFFSSYAMTSGKRACCSHRTRTFGSTDSPGFNSPSVLNFCPSERSKSIRTGTRCTTFA